VADKISSGRKATYYIGIGMIVLGVILFFSVFFFAIGSFNNPWKTPPFQNAVIGMILMIAGSVLLNIGAKGAAGSGMILDPEKAREDLKPYNEAKGEMINDTLEQVKVLDKFTGHNEVKEVVKIKCRGCGALNDEDAKFCKGCGERL
jgi:hypothetical protein